MYDAYGSKTKEEKSAIDRVFDEVDIDGNGSISYSEWLTGSVDKRQLLTQEKLEAAFAIFDKDGGGTLNLDEIQYILMNGQENDSGQKDQADEQFRKLIAEIDYNGDGEIDFIEFSSMMHKLVEPNIN